MTNLTQRVLGTSLLAGSLFLNGCATPPGQSSSDGEKIMDGLSEFIFTGGTLFRGAAREEARKGNIQKANAYETIGGMQDSNFQRQTAIKAAQEGRSQVDIVNYGQSNNNSLSEEKTDFREVIRAPGYYTVYYSGLGRVALVFSNGSINFNERRFRGVKKQFSNSEPMSISAGVFDNWLGAGALEFQLIDLNDEKEIVKYNPPENFSSYEVTKKDLGLGPGEYRAFLRAVNGDIIIQNDFRITE